MTIHIVFVCLGNICRSPSAQGILEKLVNDAKLQDKITVDSCGTAAFNVVNNIPTLEYAACQRRAIQLNQQIMRQITPTDYQKANYIISMDNINLMSVKAWAPADYQGELSLLCATAATANSRKYPTLTTKKPINLMEQLLF